MSGRALSEEEFAEVVKRQNKWDEEPFGVYPDENNPAFIQERLEMSWLASKVPDLIATIRDRDKTIANLRKQDELSSAMYEHLGSELAKMKKQNTILHEALEKIAFEAAPSNRHRNTARGALDKVGR